MSSNSPDLRETARRGFAEGRRVILDAQHNTLRDAPTLRDPKELFNAVKNYIARLERSAAERLGEHSAYYWFYQSRRLRIPILRALSAHLRKSSDTDFKREFLGHSWFEHRFSLAIVKYGGTDFTTDMLSGPPRFDGTHGYSTPKPLSNHDLENFYSILGILTEFERARYCMKVAGKGGQFVWNDEKEGDFDIAIQSDEVKRLIDSFDSRLNRGTNLLSPFGSWAPTEVGENFPLPHSPTTYSGISLAPSDQGPVTLLPLLDDEPALLELAINLYGNRSPVPWTHPLTGEQIDPPPWLFLWWQVRSLLPRLQMYCGLLQQDLGGVDGTVQFDPEDVVFALAALSGYQRKSSEETPIQWISMLSYGYSVLNNPMEIVDAGILPIFQMQRKRFARSYRSSEDPIRLKAAIKQLVWDNAARQDIDIITLTPIRPIVPIGERQWLVDWTLIIQTVYDWLEPLAGKRGTAGKEKGLDAEDEIANFLSREARKFDATTWRVGRPDGNLLFSDGAIRDADLALVVKDLLFIVEIKAMKSSRALSIVGDPDYLNDRWQHLQKKAAQAESLAVKLAATPCGKNFKIPAEVKRIVPVLCSPHAEWIPTMERRFWLYDDIPYVCRPPELLECIKRVRDGNYPGWWYTINGC